MEWWCRFCGEPVRRTRGGLPGDAVHEAEPADGHETAPTDEDPVLRREADAIEAEFGGRFTISVRFGFFRADWARLAPGEVGANYTADTAADLRRKLAALLRVRS